LADPDEAGSYSFELGQDEVVVRRGMEELIQDVMAGIPASKISARFHNGLAQVVHLAVEKMYQTQVSGSCPSGGVWQNLTLIGRTLSLLRRTDSRYTYIVRCRQMTAAFRWAGGDRCQ